MKNNMSDRYGAILYQRCTTEDGKRYNEPIARFKTVGDALDCCDILSFMSEGQQSFFVFDKKELIHYETETCKIH